MSESPKPKPTRTQAAVQTAAYILMRLAIPVAIFTARAAGRVAGYFEGRKARREMRANQSPSTQNSQRRKQPWDSTRPS